MSAQVSGELSTASSLPGIAVRRTASLPLAYARQSIFEKASGEDGWMPGSSQIKSWHDDCGCGASTLPDMRHAPRHTFATPRRDAPESCIRSSAPLEGVGNAGCPLHPRPRVHFVLVERTRVTTSTPESPGIPARNGFNSVCRALPGDRAVLPPSSAD